MMKDPLRFLEELAAKYGDVVQFRLGLKKLVLINHPEVIQDILVTNAAKFEKGVAGKMVKLFLGESLLTTQGTAHRRQRRLVQPAFHRGRLAEYAKMIVSHGEHTARNWRDGEVRDVAEEMAHLTLMVIGRALFSADVRDEADKVSEAVGVFLKNIGRMQFPGAMLLLRTPLPFSRRFHHARESLDNIIYGLIRERRKSGRDRGDLLSTLLLVEDAEQPGEKMTDQEIRDQCMTLFLAGHETAAHALAWTWWLLANNREAEAKLHAELTTVLGGRQPTLEDIPKLVYTESVIRESMRLFPPAWAVGRMTIAEHSINGYGIRPGTIVLFSQWVTHRDERFFAAPEAFLPERWNSEFRQQLPKYAYLPFGAGPRMCIGENFAWMELILLLAHLGQDWQFQIIGNDRPKPEPRITLRPRGKLLMRLHRRSVRGKA